MHQLIWLKRDIRWTDHLPLATAIASGRTTTVLFVVEPILLKSQKYSNRHWKFMWDCLQEMKRAFHDNGLHLDILQGDILKILEAIYQEKGEFELLSHMEVGIGETFQRDLTVRRWMNNHGLSWKEFRQYGVERGRKNRDDWDEQWNQFMYEQIEPISLEKLNNVPLSDGICSKFRLTLELQNEHEDMQKGGRSIAEELLSSFFKSRVHRYSNSISKPTESRFHCSRLSPHLAWGSVSMREVVQLTTLKLSQTKNKRNLSNFKSRLHWHCHFIQKLESEPQIEYFNQNPAYNTIRNELNQAFLESWKNGQTGVPLVDACMRCVAQTGYINFRMRALVVSFWTHHLFQPWQPAAEYLATQFLDFEPGIHFSQMQMQAGTVGYHTVRIYNPILNAEKHDGDAEFIKKWVPELKNLPAPLAISPSRMTPMEELLYEFRLGTDYPYPICDLEKSAAYARDKIHAIKNSALAKVNAHQIRKTHVRTK